MHPRSFDKINESNFSLDPVLQAVENEDSAAMLAYFEQGYVLKWRDHRTHKTLLFTLGENLDLKGISFIQSLSMGITDLSDAVAGAAFADHSVSDIEKISDLRFMFPHAYYGAAKGTHTGLLQNLIGYVAYNYGENYHWMNIPYIVQGAAEANDKNTLSTYTSDEYIAKCNRLLSYRILGAAQGGHIETVEHLLRCHEDLGIRRVIDDGGFSIAYRQAMIGAATTGNIGLIAKLFLHLDQQAWPTENPMELISSTIHTAARHGHYDLVFDLIGRAKLYSVNSAAADTYQRVIPAALRGAIEGNRLKLAAWLLSQGATAQDLITALTRANSTPTRESRSIMLLKLINLLDDPRLSYEAAHLNDIITYQGSIDLIPIVNRKYGLPAVSQEARTSYFAQQGLNVWFENHDRLHVNQQTKLQPCNHDAAVLVASFVTEGKTSTTALSESRVLAKAMSALSKPKKAPKPPQTTSDIIRQKILDEIDLYLKSRLKAHTNTAKALYSCVNKLTSIESIYLLINHQITMMNNKTDKSNKTKSKSALAALAKTPAKTGHSIFASLVKLHNSQDFLTTLENCKKIIESYQSEPEIHNMLAQSEIYDRPSFK